MRGLVAGSRGRPEIGLVDLHRAHQLRPVDANVLLELDRYSLAAGLDCREWVDRLLTIDPLTPQSHLMTAMYYGLYGPFEAAAAPARRSVELAPERFPPPCQRGVLARCLRAARGGDRRARSCSVRRARDLRGSFATFFRCAFEGDAAGADRAATAEMEAALTNEFLYV